jgi:hypothetical protein
MLFFVSGMGAVVYGGFKHLEYSGRALDVREVPADSAGKYAKLKLMQPRASATRRERQIGVRTN